MTKKREALVDRMIRLYGFEHEITIVFAAACENENMTDEVLECIVKSHEEFPITEED